MEKNKKKIFFSCYKINYVRYEGKEEKYYLSIKVITILLHYQKNFFIKITYLKRKISL